MEQVEAATQKQPSSVTGYERHLVGPKLEVGAQIREAGSR